MMTRIALLFAASGMLAGVELTELKMFAPAVEFVGVEWLGTNANGVANWYAGADGSPNPQNLGGISQGRITGWQQIHWLGRTYDIHSVTKTPEGAIEVTFGKGNNGRHVSGTLLMTRTGDGFYLVDVLPPESREPAARFKTSRKAVAHDGGEAR